jgi:hypothetical protein
MKHIILIVLTILTSISHCGQVIISSIVTNEINVCDNSESFQVIIKNNTGNPLSGISLNLDFPPGISYQIGSIVEATNLNIIESNVTNLNNIQLTSFNIPINDSLQFTIGITADINAVILQQNGNIFRNNVILNYSGGIENHLSASYNILFPSLNILNVTPSSISVISGDTLIRAITITNAGFGRTNQIVISDIINQPGLSLISTSLGTLNNTTDSIIISTTNFSNQGNFDNYLDYGESFTLLETLYIQGCLAQTVTSSLKAHWGCNGLLQSSPTTYGNVVIALENPALNIQSNGEITSCFSSSNSTYQLRIINTGAGVASNIDLSIFKSSGNGYDEDIYSALVPSSFKYKTGVNGLTTALIPLFTTTRSDADYACLGNSPAGKADFTLPTDINPGDTIYVDWDIYQCCVSACLGQKNMGWEYDINYENFCQTNSYSKNATPEETTNLDMSIFSETPSDISDGQALPFTFTISSFNNNLPSSNQSYYDVEFTLDDGLLISNVSTDVKWKSNNTIWAPFYADYDNNTKKVKLKFSLPEPFVISKSEFIIDILADCSEPNASNGNKIVDLKIDYHPDSTCNNTCAVNMICSLSTSVNLHCPGVNCEGLRMSSYNVERINFGISDNDLNGLPDNNSSLNFNEVKANRLMVNDTMRTTSNAIVLSNVGNLFSNLYAESNIALGSNITPINTSIEIYDASESVYITCNNIPFHFFDNGSNRIFRFEINPSQLVNSFPQFQSNNNQGFFEFEAGDSITLISEYVLTGNIGGTAEEVLIENDMFLSNLSAPWSSSNDRWFCDTYNGKITLIGYFFANSWSSNYRLNSCSKMVQQSFYMSIGNCCSNYAGGNLFPYEYRNWGHISELDVTIPVNYTVLQSYMKQYRTKKTNASATQTVSSITPFYDNGSQMKFNLSQYYEDQGGPLKHSDDGFSGTVYIELAPTCDVPVNTFENIDWKFKFTKNTALGGGETNYITSSPDQIKYTPTNLVLSSSNPYVDGVSRSVTWNLKVKNNTSNSSTANSWVHFKSPNETVDILAIIDSNGDTIFSNGDIYQLGSIAKNSSVNVSIVAKYNACSPDYIVAYSGYECSAYPDSFAYFTCPYVTYPLHVEPKSALPQVRITGETIGTGCSNIVELTVQVSSVEFGHLDSLILEVEAIGNSMSFINGSGEIDYPTNGIFTTIGDPFFSTNSFIYNLQDENSELLEEGLPGVLSLPHNDIKLKFRLELDPNFSIGDYAKVSVRSNSICGLTLPEINLAYDPSIKMTANNNAGITAEISNSWGVAWIDYDNDGYEDLFVSEYNVNKPNLLYHNNGDGTFTKVTTGALVTDTENTVSSTWGDYDNDGDNDVFLSNNTAGENKLFTNNGDGTFTKGTSGDINNYGGYCHNATWVDYDNDGYLDLFVTDYMPTKFNKLYHNLGDGTFESITDQIVTSEAFTSIGSTWADYDNDGDLDAYVPNTGGQNNALYKNNGNGQFEKILTGAIVLDSGNSVGASWGDYNNDGYLDLFVANTGGQSDFLYANNQNGTFSKITNSDITIQQNNSSGSSWIDLDNDGDLDLFVSADLGSKSSLFVNDGLGNFSLAENTLTQVLGNSYPNAWADYDNDGDMDAFVGNRNGELNQFFENDRGACNNWFCVKLLGTTSNQNGIGAKVRIKAAINGSDVWQTREVSSQTGGGAGSQSTMRAMFGLGITSTVDSLIIEWPSGVIQYLTNISANGCNDITEPQGNFVCGLVYLDENENGLQDPLENGLPNQMLKITPGDKIVTTNNLGEYSLYLLDGNYNIEQILDNNWNQINPLSYIPIAVVGESNCGNNFGNKNTCNSVNLSVLTGATALRRGFQNEISVTIINESGYDASNVTFELELDHDIIPVNSSIPWDGIQVLDSTSIYSLNIASINSFESIQISIQDSVAVFAELGKFAMIKSSVSSVESECDQADNEIVLFEEIVGSVDPNDKLVYPRKENGIYQANKTERLHYTIRFQNTGTYYASRVRLVDTLSQFVDPSTILFEATSHTINHRIENGIIIWETNDIFLPDSAQDLLGSQGFVKFSILPKKNVPHNSYICNQAGIQFDYNEYVITNSVATKIVNWEIIDQESLTANGHPNPTNDLVNLSAITSAGNYVKIVKVNVYSASGKHLEQINLTGQSSTLVSLFKYEPGLYHLEIEVATGKTANVKIIKQ